jgi:hypothetical protein
VCRVSCVLSLKCVSIVWADKCVVGMVMRYCTLLLPITMAPNCFACGFGTGLEVVLFGMPYLVVGRSEGMRIVWCGVDTDS